MKRSAAWISALSIVGCSLGGQSGDDGEVVPSPGAAGASVGAGGATQDDGSGVVDGGLPVGSQCTTALGEAGEAASDPARTYHCVEQPGSRNDAGVGRFTCECDGATQTPAAPSCEAALLEGCGLTVLSNERCTNQQESAQGSCEFVAAKGSYSCSCSARTPSSAVGRSDSFEETDALPGFSADECLAILHEFCPELL
jgi:hypothetical protein